MTHEDGKTILIADDNRDRLTLVALLMEQAGYEVLTAGDGQEAFEVARGERPLVVISDVMMPRATGIDLCRWMRADEELRAVPVLLVSALRVDEASPSRSCAGRRYLEAPSDRCGSAKRARLRSGEFEAALRESEERTRWPRAGPTLSLGLALKAGRDLLLAALELNARLRGGRDRRPPEEGWGRAPRRRSAAAFLFETHTREAGARTSSLHRVLHKDGDTWCSAGMAVRTARAGSSAWRVSTDITERKLTRTPRHDALHASLTGLPTAPSSRTCSATRRRARDPRIFPFAVLFVDSTLKWSTNSSAPRRYALWPKWPQVVRVPARGDTVGPLGGDDSPCSSRPRTLRDATAAAERIQHSSRAPSISAARGLRLRERRFSSAQSARSPGTSCANAKHAMHPPRAGPACTGLRLTMQRRRRRCCNWRPTCGAPLSGKSSPSVTSR